MYDIKVIQEIEIDKEFIMPRKGELISIFENKKLETYIVEIILHKLPIKEITIIVKNPRPTKLNINPKINLHN